jgi:hypothetical protein
LTISSEALSVSLHDREGAKSTLFVQKHASVLAAGTHLDQAKARNVIHISLVHHDFCEEAYVLRAGSDSGLASHQPDQYRMERTRYYLSGLAKETQ